MENPRPEKVAVVEEVQQRLTDSQSVIVTEYRGLTVEALAELRRALRPAGGSFKIYKNTLVRRAASQANVSIDDHLTGPTALAFTENTPEGDPGEVVVVAKALQDFAKANPELVIKGGIFEGEEIGPDEVKALASVEPREVLLAKFAGLLQAPMSQFAGLLQAVPRDFAYGLKALVEKGGAAPASDSSASKTADEAVTEEEPPETPDEPAVETVDADPAADASTPESEEKND